MANRKQKKRKLRKIREFQEKQKGTISWRKLKRLISKLDQADHHVATPIVEKLIESEDTRAVEPLISLLSSSNLIKIDLIARILG